MPHTLQAKKRVRQTARKTEVNRARMNRVRSFVRKVEQAIAAGDKEVALAALRAAEPETMRGASSGVLHNNTASRKVSRLAQRVEGIVAAAGVHDAEAEQDGDRAYVRHQQVQEPGAADRRPLRDGLVDDDRIALLGDAFDRNADDVDAVGSLATHGRVAAFFASAGRVPTECCSVVDRDLRADIQDVGDAEEFAREHPDRQEVRIVAGATRGGSTYCALRLRSHDDDQSVVGGNPVKPCLAGDAQVLNPDHAFRHADMQ